MSRTLQDQFIDDDEEETCPLCVEEFDLSDRGFRPCPCGYQICQFCYHNVRNNMNGLCPACRRQYDEAAIEFRKPSAEEEAAWRAKQAAKQKKTVVAQQKEVLKREADTANRKHLAGLRVVQKNLVYVTGLSPSVQEDHLLETLRGPQYFGQYGKIVKIVVSKAKDNQSSVGVYVTYARKEDAASCINAVDGSQNGERTLRAQFGTTKYCSAYLRNEQCQNRNCMFLHEPGEDKDSFTRQDLSSMNVASTQQQTSTFAANPPPQSQQPVAAARPDSTVPPPNSSEPGPALPSTASWAAKQHPPSRSVSRAATATSSSPALTSVQPSQPTPETSTAAASTTAQEPDAEEPVQSIQQQQQQQEIPESINPFVEYIDRVMTQQAFDIAFGVFGFTEEQRKLADDLPCMFDPSGGKKRRLARTRIEEEQQRRLDGEEQLQRSGSLQLGGEPEDQQHALQAGSGQDSALNNLDGEIAQLSLNAGGMTAAQQHLLQQRFQSSPSQQSVSSQQASFSGQFGPSNPPGHARNVSRFSFANDSTAATSVKPVANSKLMQQQSSMMPPQSSNAFSQQSAFYTSTVSGPPPGLKTTGTPPVSGGGMFGQGHGFATGGLGYGSNMPSRNSNDEMMRELFRRRDLGAQDAGKQTITQSDDNDPFGTPSGASAQQYADLQSRGRSTPTIPPGLEGLGQVPSAASASQASQVPGLVKPAIPAMLSRAVSAAGSRKASIASAISRPATPSAKHVNDDSAKLPATTKEATTETASKVPASSALDKIVAVPSASPVVTPRKEQQAAQPSSVQRSKAQNEQVRTPVTKATAATTDASIVTSTSKALPETPLRKTKHVIAESAPSASTDTKRKHPGKIDLTTVVNQRTEAVKTDALETPIKASRPGTPSVSSRPASPLSVVEVTGKKRVNTIRIVNVPQPAPVINTPFAAAVAKIPSRNPSIASAHPPGTPSSEHISDNVSLTSASISRPHSPTGTATAGSIVGSAPLSKSAAAKKRERQRRQQEQDQKTTESEIPVTEPVQEAITSHKRSTKSKSATTKPKPKPIPEVTIQETTSPALTQTSEVDDQQAESTAGQTQEPEPEHDADHSEEWDPVEWLKDSERNLPPFVAKALDTFYSTVAQTAAMYKPTQPIIPEDLPDLDRPYPRNPDAPFSQESLNELFKHGTLFRYGGGNSRIWTQGCVMPSGAHLRYLEAELEERYGLLEWDLRQQPREMRFHPDRTRKFAGINVEDELPCVDLDTLRMELENGNGKRREANAMEKAVEEGTKKGSFLVGNAEAYINEFVMPVVRGAMRKGTERPDGLEKRSLEDIEKALVQAKKVAEQKEAELRKIIKRNRKLVGIA